MNKYRGMKACFIILLFLLANFVTNAFGQGIPEEARRHMARGMAAVEMAKSPEEYGSAMREFQEASRLAPDWPDPHYNLGLVQEKSGKFREAVASLKEYLRLAPNAPDASNIKELIYKLEYKAEQVLTVPEIIDVLVSLTPQWDQRGIRLTQVTATASGYGPKTSSQGTGSTRSAC